jgi:hypothetical protein
MVDHLIYSKYKQFMEKEAKLILTDTVINGWLSNLNTNNSWRKKQNLPEIVHLYYAIIH